MLVAILLACSQLPQGTGSDWVGGYEDGPYHCCDSGDACCPDGSPAETMCYEYGGAYGRCMGSGEEFDGHMECVVCCAGMTETTPMKESDLDYPGYPAGCGPLDAHDHGTRLCVACGD